MLEMASLTLKDRGRFRRRLTSALSLVSLFAKSRVAKSRNTHTLALSYRIISKILIAPFKRDANLSDQNLLRTHGSYKFQTSYWYVLRFLP